MGLISFGGLGSGLDVNSIIDAIVNAERAPRQFSLDSRESRLSVTLSGIGALKSSLDGLKTPVNDLADTSNYSQRFTKLDNVGFFSASASTTATVGNYDIEVVSIAKGSEHKTSVFTGGSTTTFGNGTLTFTSAAKTFNVSVTSTDTLADIRTKINEATDNDFVETNLLNNITDGGSTGSILTLQSTNTGTGNDLAVTYTGDAALADLSTNLTSISSASDASINIDGLTATSTTNTFENTIDGVTITTVKANTTGETSNLTVDLDKSKVSNLLNDFVEAFNAYAQTAKALGSADLEQPGALLSDATLRQVDSQIRSQLSTIVPGAGNEFNSLSAIGIETQADGTLEIDSTVLNDALDNNFDNFETLFTSAKGFATQLDNILTTYTESSGILDSRETSINAQLKKITNERLDLDFYISQLQERLVAQYAAVDVIVAQFNNTSSFLTQQLANLPGFSSGSNNES